MSLSRRQLFGRGAAALAFGAVRSAAAAGPAPATAPVRIQRLRWAGLKIEVGACALFIDPQVVFQRKAEIGSDAALLATAAAQRVAAVTHIHGDHFDPGALELAVGKQGTVACHAPDAAVIAAAGFRPLALEVGQGASLTDFETDDIYLVPAFAMDGWGDDQVSWVVLAGGLRLFHGGDTIWHGRFRHLGRQYGPFDVAFLPINGVRQPGRIDPALESRHTLGPDEAVEAALALRARQLVPIHYGRAPGPAYVETPNAAAAAVEQGRRRGLPVKVVAPGEFWSK